MKCSFCRNEIKDGSRFCPKCGKQIPFCPKCGKQITEKTSFCSGCGTKWDDSVLSLIMEMPDLSISYNQIDVKKRYCKQCGSICDEGQFLCNNCASKLKKPIEPQKKKSRIPVILLIMLLVLGLAAGAAFGISKLLKDDAPISQSRQKDVVVQGEGCDESTQNLEIGVVGSESPSNEANEENNESVNSSDSHGTEAEKSEPPVEEESNISTQDENPDFILANSSNEYLTEADLAGLNAEECRIARNEIYARHGRKFDSEELQNYFSAFEWYKPSIESSDFEESSLNKYELANTALIVEFEKKQGYR